MAKIDTKDLFDRAEDLKEQRRSVLEQQIGVRETLRNLRDSGMLTEQEEELLEEIFPTRTRNVSGEVEED